MRVVGRPAGQSVVRGLPPNCGHAVVRRQCQVPGLKERRHGRQKVGAGDAYALRRELRRPLPPTRTDARTGSGDESFATGGDEGLERFRVERARQHERLVDRNVQDALDLEERDFAIAPGLDEGGLEIRPLDAGAEDLVSGGAATRLEALDLLEPVVREREVPNLDLVQAIAQQRQEVRALNVDRDAAPDFGLLEPRGAPSVGRSARAGEDPAALKDRLREVDVRVVRERLAEHRADDIGAGVLDDLRVRAVESELREPGRACRRDLRLGDVELRGGEAGLVTLADGTRDCLLDGQAERIGRAARTNVAGLGASARSATRRAPQIRRKERRSDMLLNTAKGRKSMGIRHIRGGVHRRRTGYPSPRAAYGRSGVVDENQRAAATDDSRKHLEHRRVDQARRCGRRGSRSSLRA